MIWSAAIYRRFQFEFGVREFIPAFNLECETGTMLA
jgi:hypothetical protein